jgi:hypothetical protein
MKKLIGKKDGKRVYATYSAGSGSLPELKIGDHFFRGSSLGPANYMVNPSSEDIEYWIEIARNRELID